MMRFIRQSWLVLVLAVLIGGGLAALHAGLSDKIRQNRIDETFGRVPTLVPGAVAANTQEARVGGRVVYRAIDDQGRQIGWVVPAGGQGFADRIEVLIGTDLGVTEITGLYVLDQKETPGLGNFITEESFTRRFVGMPTDVPVRAVKLAGRPGEVQAIIGATISSESVANIVNRALEQLRQPLAEAAAAGSPQ